MRWDLQPCAESSSSAQEVADTWLRNALENWLCNVYFVRMSMVIQIMSEWCFLEWIQYSCCQLCSVLVYACCIKPSHCGVCATVGMWDSIVSDEDLCGQNVLHFNLFSRDCSTIAQSYLCRSNEPLPNCRNVKCVNVSLHALHSLHTGSHHDVCCSSPSDNSMAAVPDHYRWSFCPEDTLEFTGELIQSNPVCYPRSV